MVGTCFRLWEVGILILALMEFSSATLSTSGVNYEVVALMAIKSALHDPYNVMENWDINYVDPCSWRMITCSPDGFVSALGLPSQSLSGTLSPSIGNLSNLQSVFASSMSLVFPQCERFYFVYSGHIMHDYHVVTIVEMQFLSAQIYRLLQNNAILGPIPVNIGKLQKLRTLDLSNNSFSGQIPTSLGDLGNLNYLRLNNNSLTGPCPESLSTIKGLTLVDLSFNNLSGSLPKLSAKTFKVTGNPLICRAKADSNCSAVLLEPLSLPPDGLKDSGSNSHRAAIAFGASFSGVFVLVISVGLLVWGRYKHNQQIFFYVNEQYDPEVCLGHLRKYKFKELLAATNHFSSKNILGKGGFGIVYKGCLNDGTLVAVKRLKDYNAAGGEIQFQTEVETIGLAVHRNLLGLCGFCMTEDERLLVYPYMPNGSVASRLKDYTQGQPALDWERREKIALGTARGLVYLHEQCDPKIIHRDIKAANILLDENFEAIVGDFGLAKLLDHRDSHVTTAVRGTVGHIAPEYLLTGQSSEKTDVFGYGILLLELITGQKAMDFGRAAKQKGVMLDWVKKLHQDAKLGLMVDKDLKGNYDRVKLEEMVQVALLCTQFNPAYRPKMSKILKMLEGEGSAKKWEASQRVETPRFNSYDDYKGQRYSDFIEESSLVVETMELSGPR